MIRGRRPPARGDWTRYAAPAAFLLGVTIAVLLIRSGLEGGRGADGTPRRPTATTTAPRRPPATTTTRTRSGTTAAPGAGTYTVVAGDTFGVIASKSGTSVSELERLNPGVRSTSLHIGQKIRVR